MATSGLDGVIVAKDVIKEADRPKICPKCSGNTVIFVDDEDGGAEIVCPACNGSGYSNR